MRKTAGKGRESLFVPVPEFICQQGINGGNSRGKPADRDGWRQGIGD
ncbi:hypothetical protein Xenpb_03884 [Xenorhabdus sp. PB62.4]|nr:hypothetical protein [Xenorhabdus sp. PB62.4]MBC8955070.1 hypothetical protein [Xenorhabdus sp. PB62.4]